MHVCMHVCIYVCVIRVLCATLDSGRAVRIKARFRKLLSGLSVVALLEVLLCLVWYWHCDRHDEFALLSHAPISK